MAKKKPATKKAAKPKPAKFSHGDIVTFTHDKQEVDALVLGHLDPFYYLRLIGAYRHICPDVPLQKVEAELTLASLEYGEGAVPLARLWNRVAAKHLLGRTITHVHYMSEDECAECDWQQAGLVLDLDDGTQLWPCRDDEGNGPGALHGVAPGTESQEGTLFIIPVI